MDNRGLHTSSFAGVSVITEGKVCTTTAVDVSTESGYHLLLVQGYSRIVQEIPNGKRIRSGPFMVGGHQWRIYYAPNGAYPSCADFISVHLHLIIDPEDAQLPPVDVHYDFSFVDRVEEQKQVYICAAKTCSFSSKVPGWGRNKFAKRDALERTTHLTCDCLTIRCDITVFKVDPNTRNVTDIDQHFSNLLQNKVGADMTFEVSGETFVAHRCVLAARSTIFKAQLFGPMKKGTTSGVIQIKDMEAKVFKALLSFIYTGACFDTEEEAVEHVMFLQGLFVAAERYDLKRLKLLCEDHLSEDIGVSSVASTLALAEKHHCHGLKEACFKFIQIQSPKGLKTVMATNSWENMITTYPSVLNELVAKLVCNQRKGKKRKLRRM